MPKFGCPYEGWNGRDENDEPIYFLVLPEQYFGLHIMARDKAAESVRDFGSPTITNLARAMAVLEDWHIPGLPARPEEWDFSKLRAEVIGWIISTVEAHFKAQFVIPKKDLSNSPNQSVSQSKGLQQDTSGDQIG